MAHYPPLSTCHWSPYTVPGIAASCVPPVLARCVPPIAARCVPGWRDGEIVATLLRDFHSEEHSIERLNMNSLRDLIHRLRANESERRIARDLRISRTTVRHYHQIAERHGLLSPDSPMPDDATLAPSALRPTLKPRAMLDTPLRFVIIQHEYALDSRISLQALVGGHHDPTSNANRPCPSHTVPGARQRRLRQRPAVHAHIAAADGSAARRRVPAPGGNVRECCLRCGQGISHADVADRSRHGHLTRADAPEEIHHQIRSPRAARIRVRAGEGKPWGTPPNPLHPAGAGACAGLTPEERHSALCPLLPGNAGGGGISRALAV